MFSERPEGPVLSDEETGALLDAMREDEAVRQPEAREADLASKEGPLRQALGRADRASEEIGKDARLQLLRQIGAGVDVELMPAEIVPRDVFDSTRDEHALVYTLRGRTESAGCVVIDPPLAAFVLERSMGGAPAESPAGAVHEGFSALARSILDDFPQALAASCAEHLLSGRALRAEPLQEDAATGARFEPVLRLGLRFSQKGEPVGEVTFAVHGAALSGGAPRALEASGTRDVIRQHIVDAEVTVVATLGRAHSSVRELLALSGESVLRLDGAPGDPVTLCVDEVVVARGNPVVRKGDLAIEICELEQHEGRVMSDETTDSAEGGAPAALAGSAPRGNDLDRILDIPLEIHVELGRRRMRIHELLQIEVGSVMELGTAAGAPLSIFANRVLVAQGEAVIVGERYGIRITDIVPAGERVRRLGGKEAA